MLVSTNAAGPRIERSTWLSAAKWTTASRPVLAQQTGDQRPVQNRAVNKRVRRIALQRGEVVDVAGIGQRVEIHDLVAAPHSFKDKVGADKACATRHQ